MKTTSAELKTRAKQTLSSRYGLCIGAQFIQLFLTYAVLMALIGVFVFKIMTSLSRYDYTSIHGFTGLEVSPHSTIFQFGGTLLLMIAAEVVLLALISVLSMGIKKIYLNLCLGRPAGVGDMFYAFSHKMHRFIGLYFINMLVGFVLNIPYMILSAVSLIADNVMFLTGLMQLFNILQVVGSVMFSLYFAQAGLIMLEDPEMKVIPSMKESARLMKGNKGDLFYLYMSFFGVVCLGILSWGIGFLWIYPYIECTNTHFFLQLRESDMQARYEAYGYDKNGGSQSFESQNWQ